MVSWGCTGKGLSSLGGKLSGCKAGSGWKAPYRTIGGSTSVPVLVPAQWDRHSYGSSLEGKSELGRRVPTRGYESSLGGKREESD